MRRRSRAGGELSKARRRKTETLKRGDAPKAVAVPRSSEASRKTEVARLTRELHEALEQRVASSEILRIISGSPTDVQQVFDTIVASAVRLCGARMGAVYRFDGGLVHLVAHYAYSPEVLEVLHRTYPRPPGSDQASGRAILSRAIVQIEDTFPIPTTFRGSTCRQLAEHPRGADAARGPTAWRDRLRSNEPGPFPSPRSNWSRTSPTRR